MNSNHYDIHPYAEIFPQMTPDEWETFVADIEENGVRVPLVMYQGKILDGRHRYQAVCDLYDTKGVWIEFDSMEFTGNDADALRYVYSANLHRRHLTTGQRACIGVEIKKHLQESITLGRPPDNVSKSGHINAGEAAADMVNVSRASVYKAEKIAENAPDLFERVLAGEMPLSAAETALAVRTGEQTPAQAVKAVAAEIVAAVGVENVTEAQLEKVARVIVHGDPAHVSHNTGMPEWYTPSGFIEAARAVMGAIDLDPATSEVAQKTVQAKTYYTAETDGLAHDWQGCVWMNPPYTSGLIDKFMTKLVRHFVENDVVEAITLTNNATETEWFQCAAEHASAICFPSGRIRFIGEDGVKGAPLQGQAIMYFGCHRAWFIEHFRKFGLCVEVSVYE